MMNSSSSIKMSVIIPTKNRREHLKECLQSLFEASLRPDEVIVLDICSTDGTEETAKQFAVTLLKVNEPNRQRQKNIALLKTTGDIVVFLDDDVIIDKLALKHVMKAYSAEVGGVGGRVLPYGMPKDHWLPACENIVGKIRRDGFVIGNFDIPLKKPIEVDCLQGCFMSFRRKALLEAGGFDESYGSGFRGDDTDVTFAVKQLGYKIVYEPKAVVWHKALGKISYTQEEWVYSYVRGCTYFYFKNIFSKKKRYLPWFFFRLLFPPRDYVAKSGISIQLTIFFPLSILRGTIDGIVPYLKRILREK
jgi:GT2 family glycosyltransferase